MPTTDPDPPSTVHVSNVYWRLTVSAAAHSRNCIFFAHFSFAVEPLLKIVTYLHTQIPKEHFGASLFAWLIVVFIYIRPLLVPCLALWTSPCVTRQSGCWLQRLTHGTAYKHIRHSYQKHVTRNVNHPAILIFHLISAVTLHAVPFTVGARGARLHLSTTIKRNRIL